MANIKSAKKRVLVAERNAMRNKSIKSEVKTAIKKVDAAIEANDAAAAKDAYRAAVSVMDAAASKGVYHKKTVARKASRLQLAINKLA